MNNRTEEVVSAFVHGQRKVNGNTVTDGVNLYLHNNCIASKDRYGQIHVTMAGWPTRTTRERLNGLVRMVNSFLKISQQSGHQTLDYRGESIMRLDPDEWYSLECFDKKVRAAVTATDQN